MNTPEPLMIGGQPVVVGRIVHLESYGSCVAVMVQKVLADDGTILVNTLGSTIFGAEPREARFGDALLGTWHWPDANKRQCQGRA